MKNAKENTFQQVNLYKTVHKMAWFYVCPISGQILFSRGGFCIKFKKW